MKWGEEEDKILRDMYAQGFSFGKISEKLIGRSRNSTISRADRIGLPKRDGGRPRKQVHHAKTIRRKSPFHFGPAVDAAPPLAFTPKAAKVEPLMIAFADLGADQCRFAYGEEQPYFFCGHSQKEGSSYCEKHHRLCHNPAPQPTPRAERRAA